MMVDESMRHETRESKCNRETRDARDKRLETRDGIQKKRGKMQETGEGRQKLKEGRREMLFCPCYKRQKLRVLETLYTVLVRQSAFWQNARTYHREMPWTSLQRYNTESSKQIFPEKELRGLIINFHIHVSVSDLYILTIGLPILLQENMWIDPGNI